MAIMTIRLSFFFQGCSRGQNTRADRAYSLEVILGGDLSFFFFSEAKSRK